MASPAIARKLKARTGASARTPGWASCRSRAAFQALEVGEQEFTFALVADAVGKFKR